MLKPYKKAEISFREIREIGHDGQNSCVHLVHDSQLDAEIVIKRIHKSRIADVNKYFEEAQLLYKSRHTNVVNIYYACEDNDYIYLAMPFYQNGSINKVTDNRFLTVREIIRYSIQFIAGLHNIHSEKLIHFDIKPDNVLINKNNEAMISDFGQSKPVNYLGVAEQDSLYVKQRPPESFDVYTFDLRYDIYQVGVTLYRMCNGNKHFFDQYSKFTDSCGILSDRDAFKFAVKNGKFPNRDVYLPHIPQKMRNIIKKCLEITPDNRYKNCVKLVNDLANIEDALDWKYKKLNGSEEWCYENDKRVIKLIRNNTGFIATKKIKSSGNIQNMRRYCKSDMSKRELFTFFKEEEK